MRSQLKSVLWVRLHLIRIRKEHFINLDPDPAWTKNKTMYIL